MLFIKQLLKYITFQVYLKQIYLSAVLTALKDFKWLNTLYKIFFKARGLYEKSKTIEFLNYAAVIIKEKEYLFNNLKLAYKVLFNLT